MEIRRNGAQPSGKGPADRFTVTVRIDPLFQAHDPARVSGGSVTFEPGARSAWHTHPLGQTLIVTAGAKATTAMTHIAILEALNGKVVDWMEKVGDDQYPAF
ncbi:MAG TPA: cupin domain-containing protein [Reyranella sp.]|jgi:quercetin dioxygenase-like cupin family protein